eukprot:m.33645 g.33645  ORF g.33645 m.33645 type:complete len:344 (+) comp12249_c0_seq3:103-1134(+)
MGGCCSVDKAGELSSQDLDLALGNGPQGVLSGRSSSRTKGAVANFAPSNWAGLAEQNDTNLVTPLDESDELPSDLSHLVSTSVSGGPCKEPLGPDAQPSKPILKAATLRTTTSTTVRTSTSTTTATSRTTTPEGSVRRRSVTYLDDDGQQSIRFESYAASQQREAVEEQLTEQLSRRSSRHDLVKRRILFQEGVEVITVDHMTAEDRHVEPTWASLTAEDKLHIRKELNELKAEMPVHEESKGNTRWHPDGPKFPQFVGKVGHRVKVHGMPCHGVLRFYGPHKTRPGPRCGIELDEPVGLNDGMVNGHRYFSCPSMHGLLCNPAKVFLLEHQEAAEESIDGFD